MQTIHVSQISSTFKNSDRFIPVNPETVKPTHLIPPVGTNPKKKKQDKRYALPVPEELKVFKTPKANYIRKYLSKLYPNLEMMAYLKCHNRKIAKSIVADFIMYILGETRTGVPRYTLYDPIKYPNQPYYKWLMVQIRYFFFDYCEEEQKYYSRNVSLVENLPEEEYIPNTLSMNSLVSGVENGDPFYAVSAGEIKEYIKNLAEAFNEEDVKKCFESESYRLLKARLEDVPIQKFAKDEGVKQTVVKEWLSELRTLVGELYCGKEPSYG